MSKSKSFDLCYLTKRIWEQHPKNKDREYDITGRDLKEAKLLLEGNGEIQPDKLQQRMNRYMESEFEGWVENDYPLWGLFKHWTRYAPSRQKIKVVKMGKCEYCGLEIEEAKRYQHWSDCPKMRKVTV